MKPNKQLVAILAVFAILAIASSWGAIVSGGYFSYRDEWSLPNLDLFKDEFIHLWKAEGFANLDFEKRIVELWIHYFIGYDLWDRVKFALLGFATLVSSFYVSRKILQDEGMKEGRMNIIAAATAAAYFINPLNTQLFISYYPAINYAIFPLFFYSLYLGFTRNDRRAVFLSGIICSFMFLMVLHTVIYVPVAFLALCIVLPRHSPRVGQLAANAALFALTCLFATAFILLPSAVISSVTPLTGSHALTENMLDTFSAVAHLPKAMLMDFHVFWWPYVDYTYPFGSLFFLLAFLFAGALLTRALYDRNDWAVMSVAALAALFLLSKGNAPPFGNVYEFINFYLPLGWLIRVPMKFAHILPFFFSILFLRFAVFTSGLGTRALCAFILPSLLFLSLFSSPFFTGDAAGVLKKTDYTSILSDASRINSAIHNDHPYILNDGFDTKGFINTDLSDGGAFISHELKAYSQFSDWKGAAFASGLGFMYLLVPAKDEKAAAVYYPEIVNGSEFSLFQLTQDSPAFSIPPYSALGLCSFDTVRSLIRDPPPGGLPQMLLFPYSSADFPQQHIDVGGEVVLDSAPLPVIPAAGAGSSFYFPASVTDRGPSAGWSYKGLFQDNEKWNDEYDFGDGFAVTKKSAAYAGACTSDKALSLGDLELKIHDNYSTAANASFAVRPQPELQYSTVTAGLRLESGSDYETSISVNGSSMRFFSAEFVFINDAGDVVSVLPLVDANGTFSKKTNLQFSVPFNASRIELVLSSKAGGKPGAFTIRSFEVSRRDCPRKGQNITAYFNTQESGAQEVWLRLLKSPDGGELRLYLDGASIGNLTTTSDTSHFYWERVYEGVLRPGTHSFTVEQLEGFNALNIGYVRKNGSASADFSNKTIVYRLTGRSDFSGSGAKVVEDNASSTFYSLRTSYPAHSSVEVVSPGVYTVSYGIRGNATMLIDGSEPGAATYLAKGLHNITVWPSAGPIYIDDVTLVRSVPHETRPAEIVNYTRTDPSTYSLWVNSTGPFFLSFAKQPSPFWVARANGHDYLPVISYGAVDSYYINETGLNRIEVEFAPQKLFYAGMLLGVVGLAACAVYVLRWRK